MPDKIENSVLELIQKIGNYICEGCGPYRDCEEEYEDCLRIQSALSLLNEYIKVHE